MGIGGSLRELAGFIDACEADGQVCAVELGAIEPAGDGRLTADVTVEFSLRPDDGDVALADVSLGDDGRLQLAFETTGPTVPTTSHDVSVEPSSTTVNADGTATVTLTASVATAGTTTGRDERSGAGADAGADDANDATDAGEPDRSADVRTTSESAASERRGAKRLVAAESRGDEAASDRAGGRRSASDVPPFEDRELLQRVYDEHDTFAEMPAALGMDVTAETVRRYMIDYGIHEPRSYDTSPSDGDDADPSPDAGTATDAETEADSVTDAESQRGGPAGDDLGDGDGDGDGEEPDDEEAPVVLADGIGLPEEVTVDTIVETVRESNTIYEVTRDIGVDREAALELLRELDLLEFVVGRLATEAERSISRDTVVERLRQHADAQ